MNRSILGRVFSILFLFYALAYGAFLVYSLAVFTADRALPAFQWQYAARQAFLLFVDYLIPVHVSGIVVAFSLGNRAGRTGPARNPQQSFARFVSSALAAFIFLTIVYTVLYEGLAPAQRGALADMEHQSTLARQFLELANANRKKGDFASALDYAEMYLRIDKTNQQVLQLDQELQSQASKKQLKEQPVTAPQPAVPQGLDATALLEKARYYYSQEDFFSAHYYATQASTLEPGRTDALRLAALAWDKITSVTPSQQEVEAAQLYQKKKEAYSTLMSGSPLTAYYAFTALASQYPKDNDIAEYLEESRRKVMESTFFIDEAERAALLPGTDNILFLNSDEKDPPKPWPSESSWNPAGRCTRRTWKHSDTRSTAPSSITSRPDTGSSPAGCSFCTPSTGTTPGSNTCPFTPSAPGPRRTKPCWPSSPPSRNCTRSP